MTECGLALIFGTKKLAYAVFLCNLLTNPLVNAILMLCYHFISREYDRLLIAFLEICVVITEALLIKAMMKDTLVKASVWSLLLNAFSFASGLLIMPFVSSAVSSLPAA